MPTPTPQRWAAFSDTPEGGNPAGVVLGADDLEPSEMLRIAARIGYAETAFVTGQGRLRGIRFFSPIAEVPFCGHATIASAVALAGEVGSGLLTFDTGVGPVEIVTDASGPLPTASFTSVSPQVAELGARELEALLDLIGVTAADLDASQPPRLVYAGNWHPLLVLADGVVFDSFGFDPTAARALLDAEGWPATIVVLHRRGDEVWEARNIFPVGTIDEDPATGAGAAATGAYLRELGLVTPPARIRIEQGRHVGRPSLLMVDVPPSGGITVSGTAVRIES